MTSVWTELRSTACGRGVEVFRFVTSDGRFVRNSELIAKNGAVELWRLAQPATGYWTAIEFVEDTLVAWDFSGVRYELDPLTGAVLSSEWVK